MRAGCYLRVSTDEQDEENQREDVEALCKMRGLSPVWFIDHAKSGASSDGRTAYVEMMAQARRGKLKAVVFWKLDRLGRKASTILVDLDDLTQAGVAVLSCRDPIDTTSASGRAVVGFLAVFAQLEREQTVERINAAYRRKKARAEALGRKVRWGRKRAEVPDEAVAMAAVGQSARYIASKLGISRRIAGYAAKVARNQDPSAEDADSPENASGSQSTVSVACDDNEIAPPTKAARERESRDRSGSVSDTEVGA